MCLSNVPILISIIGAIFVCVLALLEGVGSVAGSRYSMVSISGDEGLVILRHGCIRCLETASWEGVVKSPSELMLLANLEDVVKCSSERFTFGSILSLLFGLRVAFTVDMFLKLKDLLQIPNVIGLRMI